MMLRTLHIALGLFLVIAASAQQYPQMSQYLMSNYLYNPAAGGVTPCLDIRTGYRQQWAGFEGAPITGYVSGHTSINQNTFLNGWHGVGGYVLFDQQGSASKLQNTEVHGSYAYHLRLTQEYSLSFGASVGIKQYAMKPSLSVADPVFDGGQSVLLMPDIAAGIWLRSLENFVGLSVKQIGKRTLKLKNDFVGLDGAKLVPHVFLTAGKRIESDAYFYTFIPSAQLRWSPYYPPALDLNFMWLIMDKFGVGAGYRVVDGVMANVQYQLTNMIRIGYSIDYTTSRLGVSAPYQSSHEIVIAIKRCTGNQENGGNAASDPHHCPAYE